MIAIHLIDAQGIHTESRSVSKFAPIPSNAVFVAPPPVVPPEIAHWNGSAWEIRADRPPAPGRSADEFAASIADVVRQIDADTDALYATVLGLRTTEYQKAEDQARAYRAAGYVGDGPKAVAAWANATGESAQWAADDIIATADAWHTAEDAIREQRLMCKQLARNATTDATLNLVRIQWFAFLTQIRAQLND